MTVSSDIIIAIAAALIAVGGIAYLLVRLVQSLVIWRLFRAVRSYPNISMALALAAQGSDEDTLRFRAWVTKTIEEQGWDKTEKATGELLRRAYPLGMMGLRTAEPHGAAN